MLSYRVEAVGDSHATHREKPDSHQERHNIYFDHVNVIMIQSQIQRQRYCAFNYTYGQKRGGISPSTFGYHFDGFSVVDLPGTAPGSPRFRHPRRWNLLVRRRVSLCQAHKATGVTPAARAFEFWDFPS